jgi:hypothetical protein
MFDMEYTIIVSDEFEIPVNDSRQLEDLIVNLSDCQDENGRFKINGTHYFWVETIVPCTVERDGEFQIIFLDGLYRLRGYGGYELGGRGAFYVMVPNTEKEQGGKVNGNHEA